MPTRDSSRKNRWLAIAGLAVVAVVIAVAVVGRSPSGGDAARPRTETAGGPGGGRVDYPVNGGSASTANATTSTATTAGGGIPTVPQQVENVMSAWRTGIINQDADAVLAAEAALRGEPQKFLSALMTSAESDPNDRVRAFSTRVLGKLVDPACGPVFQRLLSDRSQYVRMNAAWGLGELAQNPQGRGAAKPALHALRRLAQSETFKDGREAASLAARRLM